RSDRCFRSRRTAKAFTRNRGSRVSSYFRDPSTRATRHCGAAAGGRHDLVFKKPLVRLHWKSQRSSRSHSRLLLFRGPFLLLRQESRISQTSFLSILPLQNHHTLSFRT